MADSDRLSLAQKFNLHSRETVDVDLVDDEVEDDEYRAFAVSPQANQRAEMIDIVSRDGKRQAFAYSHLYRVLFDPETGIELRFSEHHVFLQGLRLLSGYKRLQRQRVERVVEADSVTAKLYGREGTVITGVEIVPIQILEQRARAKSLAVADL